MTSIYVLCDPHTKAVRYVGKTILPLRIRLAAHLNEKNKGSKRHVWLHELKGRGVKPTIELIETIEDEQTPKVERWWIQYFREAGSPLVNTVLRTSSLSAESRRRISEYRKGRPTSLETRMKISAALKGRRPYVMTDAIRKRFSEVRLGVKRGVPLTDECKRKISQAKTGKPHSEFHKRRIREGRLAKRMERTGLLF